ncbi:MAG TPA: ABC transporter ATP-binding protein [Peptococcaceae bacterium]|nr:MAG: ABC transporter related protein [Clostridia bacterium 41_269]HBT20188.1 ABC transporter ATP-binding protein [Peptococcaceae bacterium]
MNLLEVRNLTLKKGENEILKKVNLILEPGEVHAVIGPNGAGKSSLAYTIMGLEGYSPKEGKIFFEGEDITNLPINERAKRGLTLAWQEPARFEGITVEQYLKISTNGSKQYSSSGIELPRLTPEEALLKVALNPEKYLKRKVDKGLSGGERKRVELASILLMRPKAVILDEPDSGIDTVAIEKIFEIIEEFKRLGIGVLLITHSHKMLEAADCATLLCSGFVVKTGSPEEAAEYYNVRCLPCPSEVYPQEEEKI